MTDSNYDKRLNALITQDSRYPEQAYYFVADAVSYTIKQRDANDASAGSHVSGGELLDGLRNYALEQFGPLALDVLAEWGITRTEDFGNIVFNMIEHRLLGKSDSDTRDDFANGYDFRQAFLRPFVEERDPPDSPQQIA